jgi:hypothetical protein
MPPAPDDLAVPLRAALRGEASARAEVLRGERPAIVDALLVRALTSAMMLGLMLAATVFRTRTTLLAIDPVLLVLHVACVAFAVRAVLSLASWAATFSADGAARGSALVLGDDALLLSVAGREHVVPKRSVLDVVVVQEGRSEARVPARATVQLVRVPGAAPFVLPPWFAAHPEALVARLRRWLGPTTQGREPPGPQGDPEHTYAAAAAGKLAPHTLAVPEGRGYLARAPYAALLGVVVAADALVHAGGLRAQLFAPAAAAGVLAVLAFAGWFVWMGRRRAVRRGLGLLLTREELLTRGSAGVVAVPWAQLAELEVDQRSAWSPVLGALVVRTLSLRTHDGQTLVFDGGFLGLPVEVVAALCEAYRKGRVEAAVAA